MNIRYHIHVMKRTTVDANGSDRAARKRDTNRYPTGLDRRKAQAIMDHHENQTEDQAVAEDEAAYHSNSITMVAVRVRLVPRVQSLVATLGMGD